MNNPYNQKLEDIELFIKKTKKEIDTKKEHLETVLAFVGFNKLKDRITILDFSYYSKYLPDNIIQYEDELSVNSNRKLLKMAEDLVYEIKQLTRTLEDYNSRWDEVKLKRDEVEYIKSGEDCD